ncbi:MAG: hypothetical protein WBK55_04870 [Alphaproteobacteria bacterium]
MRKEFFSAVGGLALLASVAGCEVAGQMARNTVEGVNNSAASIQKGFNPETAKYIAKVQRALNEAGCRDNEGRYVANDGRKTTESAQAFDKFVEANGGTKTDVFAKVTRREGIDYVTMSDKGILEVVQSAGKAGGAKRCDAPEPSGLK